MSNKRWTEAEKAQLLLSILDSKGGGVEWKNVKIPEGRTVKSCMHMLEKFRQSVQNNTGDEETASPKRKRTTTRNDEDEEMLDAAFQSPSKKRASEKKASSKQKNDSDSKADAKIKEEP